MPVISETSIPIPSLKLYVSLSVLALSGSVYYAVNKSNFDDWGDYSLSTEVANMDETILKTGIDEKNIETGDFTKYDTGSNETSEKAFHSMIRSSKGPWFTLLSYAANYTLDYLNIDKSIMQHPFVTKTADVIDIMLQDSTCALTLINTAYCCLLIIARILQYLVFGELRVSEKQHLREKFWDYLFYKIVFVVGILGIVNLEEAVPWAAWFSTLCSLLLISKLCKERFEYLAFSPTTPKWSLARLGVVMFFVLGSSLICVASAILVSINQTNFKIGILFYLLGDSLYVTIYSVFVIVRYGIHTYDIRSTVVWENRATFTYYTDLFFELTLLSVDFLHHLHLFWGNSLLSMSNILCGMKLHNLFYEIRRRLKKHRNYLQVVQLMESNFSMAHEEDLNSNSDDCAICWDKMDSARKLPCGHLFHNSCLRSWLEQDTSCPTCRTSLKSTPDEHDIDTFQESDEEPGSIQSDQPGGLPTFPGTTNRNHFFHFDSSRYTNHPFLSWLPNISVEAIWRPTLIDMDANLPLNRDLLPGSLDRLSRQVHELFPDISMNVITEDLLATRSLELTIDNILERRADGRIPPRQSSSESIIN